MAESTVCVLQPQTKPIKIIKWKVRAGAAVPVGRLLLLYDFVGSQKKEYRKLKATDAGIVHKIAAKEGEDVNPGSLLLELKACCHPTIMNDMCAECGADLRKEDVASTASVPMIHAIPDLKVSEEVAQKLGRADNERLLRSRKLVLLVDLDQTLIHTTNDNIPANLRDVYHFQLHGPHSPWYHTRLRPGTHKFLINIHAYYELHICTFGARHYAHMIANFLDADQYIFSNRILSRDECFDPTSKKANLKALFPCGDNMVCIIDDREDVWSHASNLIHVKPYHFFRHTGDINAPPGLDKHEWDNDSDAGVDLAKAVLRKDQKKETNEEKPHDKENHVEKDCVDKCQADKDLVDDDRVQKGNEENEVDETATKTENNCNGDTKESLSEASAKVADDPEISQKKEEQNSDSKGGDTNGTAELEDKIATNNGEKSVEQNGEKTEEADEVKDRTNQKDDLIDVEDPDDYLIYLEEILKTIHQEFYQAYDKLESGNIPDLKQVIPLVRSQVLKGCQLVFSGLVPNHVKLEQSKAYQVARGLGAEVTQNLNENTTHLVAVRPGTVKVNSVRRGKSKATNPKIVTPDWLWCCAERWEHVDERLFPLSARGSKNRHPPPHCGSPEHPGTAEQVPGARRKRTPSGRFMDTINPLMSFSSADIAEMDKEVEDMLSDESGSSSSENGDEVTKKLAKKTKSNIVSDKAGSLKNTSSSSSEDSLTGEYPRGFKRKLEEEKVADDYYKDSTEDESPSVKFRRGEDIEGIIDMDMDPDETQDSNSIEPPDEVDDEEWNMIGAALEREFLSNN